MAARSPASSERSEESGRVSASGSRTSSQKGAANHVGRIRVSEFSEYDLGDVHFLKDPWKDLDVPNENEVVDRASIASDQPHC